MSQHTTLTSLFSDVANAIRTKTGSSSAIAADDFPEAIEAIETGGGGEIGKNILRGTGSPLFGSGSWSTGTFRASGTPGTLNATTITDSPVPGITKAYVITGGSSQYGMAQDGYSMQGHIGDKLTFSAWVKGASGVSFSLQAYWTNTSGESESSGQSFTIAAADANTWKRYEYTTPAIQYNHNSISIGYIYVNANQSASFVGLMLEWGEAATAWLPAKEDLINIGDTDAAAGNVLASKVFYTNTGARTTGTIASKSSSDSTISSNVVSVPAGYYSTSFTKTVGTAKAAATYNTSTSDQSIAAGYYLSGAQTIKAVTTSNISAANIKKGVTIKVGDANSATRIANVTGTYTTISSGQTAVTAGAMLSGYSGFANGGNEVKGTIASKTGSNASVSNNVVSVPAGYYSSSFTKTCGTAQAAKTVYASSSNVTALAAGYYTTGAVTINKVSATNLAAANIKSGTTISISNGSSNIWSVAGTAGVRYAYSTTLSPTGTKSFSCASNTGAGSITCYYVSFNPGFTPKVIQITSKTETLRRMTWDGDLSYYCVLWDGTSYWACAGCTITSSSVQVPCSRQNEQVYVRCFA